MRADYKYTNRCPKIVRAKTDIRVLETRQEISRQWLTASYWRKELSSVVDELKTCRRISIRKKGASLAWARLRRPGPTSRYRVSTLGHHLDSLQAAINVEALVFAFLRNTIDVIILVRGGDGSKRAGHLALVTVCISGFLEDVKEGVVCSHIFLIRHDTFFLPDRFL